MTGRLYTLESEAFRHLVPRGATARVTAGKPTKEELRGLLLRTGCVSHVHLSDDPVRAAAQAPAEAQAEGTGTDWGFAAPFRGAAKPYEGHRPWERHTCEVVIPVIDPMDTLPAVLALLRLQTVKPYIILVDTGSTPEQWRQVERLENHDCSVQRIRTGGMRHTSAVVASALDLGMSLAQTNKLLFTHTDCFLRSRYAVETLCTWLTWETPAVGYGITPRPKIPDWSLMMGHVWSGVHMPRMRHRAHWGHIPVQKDGEFDTEYNFNRAIRAHGVRPLLLGHENNWSRNITSDFDHVRSWGLSGLYLPKHRLKAKEWMVMAMAEAKERAALWEKADKENT